MTIQFIVPVLSSLTFYRICYCATFPTLLVNHLSSFRIPSTCSLVCMFNSHVPNDLWTFVNLLDLPRAHQKTWKHGKWRLTTISHQLHTAGDIAVLRMFSDQHWLAWPPCLTRWCVHCSRVCAPSIAASSLAASQGLFTFPRSFFESSPSPGPNNSAWPVPLT